jgi:hypothetical protein
MLESSIAIDENTAGNQTWPDSSTSAQYSESLQERSGNGCVSKGCRTVPQNLSLES